MADPHRPVPHPPAPEARRALWALSAARQRARFLLTTAPDQPDLAPAADLATPEGALRLVWERWETLATRTVPPEPGVRGLLSALLRQDQVWAAVCVTTTMGPPPDAARPATDYRVRTWGQMVPHERLAAVCNPAAVVTGCGPVGVADALQAWYRCEGGGGRNYRSLGHLSALLLERPLLDYPAETHPDLQALRTLCALDGFPLLSSSARRAVTLD